MIDFTKNVKLKSNAEKFWWQNRVARERQIEIVCRKLADKQNVKDFLKNFHKLTSWGFFTQTQSKRTNRKKYSNNDNEWKSIERLSKNEMKKSSNK